LRHSQGGSGFVKALGFLVRGRSHTHNLSHERLAPFL
jgi:hypothetical protein